MLLNFKHTWLLVKEFLEFSSFILDRIVLQVGLKVLDSIVHHVHFHQAQNMEDAPVLEINRVFTL
jgi:hypothetical protein